MIVESLERGGMFDGRGHFCRNEAKPNVQSGRYAAASLAIVEAAGFALFSSVHARDAVFADVFVDNDQVYNWRHHRHLVSAVKQKYAVLVVADAQVAVKPRFGPPIWGICESLSI